MTKAYRVLVAAAATLLSVVICLSTPAQVYFGNINDYTYTFISILPILVAACVVVIAVLTLPALLLKGSALKLYAAAIVFIAVFALVSAQYILPQFGLLNGQALDLKAGDAWKSVELVLVVAAVAVAIVAIRHPGLAFFPATIAGGLAAVAIYNAATEPAKTADTDPQMDTVFAMSPQKNLLVVLLDAFQSDVFAEIIDEKPELKAALDGFTFFPDMMGVAPTTFFSMPALHSGIAYDRKVPLAEYFNTGVKKNSFMSALSDAGYDAVHVNAILNICPERVKCISIPEVLASATDHRLSGAVALLDIGLFRSVPLAMKNVVYSGGNWLLSPYVPASNKLHNAVAAMSVLNTFGRNIAPTSQKPTAKFIHVFSPHPPFVLDEACSFVGVTEGSWTKYKVQGRCVLQAFSHLLDGLRKNGLYDQTAIILMSDHGASRPSSYIAPGSDAGAPKDWAKRVGRASPVFAVKPFGQRGPMQTSHAPTGTLDVAATVCDVTKDCSWGLGRSAFSSDTTSRKREFNDYIWKSEYWARKPNSIPMTHYVVVGPHADLRSWDSGTATGSPVN